MELGFSLKVGTDSGYSESRTSVHAKVIRGWMVD